MTDVTTIAHRSQVVVARRGFALLGLGLVIPGSAQAAHGSRRLGRTALSLWLGLLIVAILTVAATLLFRDFMIGVLANPWVLRGAAVVIVAVTVFWVLLTIDTWWISSPARMGGRKGVVFSIVALVLALGLTVGGVWAGRAVWATGGALGNIFAGGGNSSQNKGRFNFLLLGSDAGPDRWGIRPDSINLVSVNAGTGRTVIFGLPRNLELVPFPDSSPLHALYPDGFSGCESEGDCLLNSVYLLGQEHADLYPNAADPGIQAMSEAVSAITGLGINYYAMIDMQGFIDLIDAMGGVNITINRRVALNPDDNVWLEAGVDRHLDGYETLWFARARVTVSDYDRMQRQKCVMGAMLRQLNPTTVAAKFTELAQASGDTAKTSVPPSQIGALTSLALKARALPIQSVSFTPPLIDPATPDYALIRQTVADTISGSEALDSGQPVPVTTPEPQAAPADPVTTEAEPTAVDDTTPVDPGTTEEVGDVCSVN
ncbi:MAG: LCP family protein [Propionibacteriaceae bacterium]|jgi:LCP family protein required for cell wall assembly|nr:LCP family protein [Propionibacteriaceae bacterium]